MAGMFGGSTSQAAQTPAITALQIQTSSYGKCLPVTYGKTRQAGNLIWYANFQSFQADTGGKGGKGGGKGKGCFAGETLISLPDGSEVPITALRFGVEVVSYNPDNDEIEIGKVTKLHKHSCTETGDKFIIILLANGAWVMPTVNHYFWRVDGELVEIGDYSVGDIILYEDGSQQEIVHILKDVPQPACSYNLTVEPHHNYFANGMLVHNKGGGKSGSTMYSADVMWGICEGPINSIASVWNGDVQGSLGSQGLASFAGDYAQAPWSYLTSNYPDQAIGYSGLAIAMAQAFSLGSSGTLPNINFEVAGVLFGTAGNGIDADPAAVVADLLTNPYYGIGLSSGNIGSIIQSSESYVVSSSPQIVVNSAPFLKNLSVSIGGVALAWGLYVNTGGSYTFDPSLIGQTVTINYTWLSALDAYHAFTELMGLWISPCYTDQSSANAILSDIAKYTYSEFVWSSGVLTLVPRGISSMTNGTLTYTPASAVFDLTDDDFLDNQGTSGGGGSSTSDPIQVTRLRQSDQVNNIQIEFLDRDNQYAAAIAEATDQAMIDSFRRRFSGSQSAHFFCDISAANTAAQLLLQKEYVRNKYYFTLPQQYIVLDPMDFVTLTDVHLNLDRKLVRIVEITENDDGTICFVAEEVPHTTALPAQLAALGSNPGRGYVRSYATVPANVNPPVIFDAPSQLTNGALQTWIAVSNSDPNYGGCNIWGSSDNISYSMIGAIKGSTTMGVLTSPLGLGVDPDTSSSFGANLSESLGSLSSVSNGNADLGVTLSYLGDGNGGEFIAYSTATLTGSYQYAIHDYIRRGMHTSSVQSWATDTPFTDLTNVFKYTYLPSAIGTTAYLKFVSFNVFGTAVQQLSDVTPYTHTVSGPSDVKVISKTQTSTLVANTGFLYHWTGVLVPESTQLASAHTNAQLFEQFVSFPVSNPTYVLDVLDIGINDLVTVNINVVAAPGRGVGGSSSIALELDTWMSGGSDTGSYAAWSNGLRTTGRYFVGRITMDTSVPSYIISSSTQAFT